MILNTIWKHKRMCFKLSGKGMGMSSFGQYFVKIDHKRCDFNKDQYLIRARKYSQMIRSFYLHILFTFRELLD